MDITIDQLKKVYGTKVALDIDHYTIRHGEIIGLVGNNGAGKTTLFRLMLDLLKADNGFVRIGETEVSSSEAWKETTGAYLDESFLIDYLTPEEYFYFVGRMCNLNRQTVDERLAVYERFMNDEILGQKKLIAICQPVTSKNRNSSRTAQPAGTDYSGRTIQFSRSQFTVGIETTPGSL